MKLQLDVPVYIVLVGIPYSGKSHFSKELEEHVRNSYHNEFWFKILSTDDYIEKVAKEKNTTYGNIFSETISDATKNLKQNQERYIDHTFNIIHDQTNMTKHKRMEILKKLPEFYLKVCVLFEIDEKTLKERMEKRTDKIIHPNIIEAMKGFYDPPSLDEGFDIIINQEQFWNLGI
jgi:tRNA uridine 5-carbamoylmethylation protein Kti12